MMRDKPDEYQAWRDGFPYQYNSFVNSLMEKSWTEFLTPPSFASDPDYQKICAETKLKITEWSLKRD